ncbi:MAG: DASH family cryptochrome, partial [Pseudomonadota bacterium]
AALPPITELPPPLRIDIDAIVNAADIAASIKENKDRKDGLQQGGSTLALEHLNHYFSPKNRHPSRYKQTRNDLDGWWNSCKLSCWLAHRCLSPRQVVQTLQEYEQAVERNDSTEWIYLELLWREYFQWYAYHYDKQLFAFSGITQRKPLTSFYPQRFKQWCEGSSQWPLVNACMKQLNQTGFMSNRGRQIVASCLVNELQIDWRYGAAYFEEKLIDYDVGANWGNWQYIAGVGADPRGGRHFHIEKQTQQYDPNSEFIQKWQGRTTSMPIDHLDAADWPIKIKADDT